MVKVGRPRSAVPKLCGLCGVQVGKNNMTARCRQCSNNAFCPTLEQIAEAGAEIRLGWADKQPECEKSSHEHRKQFVPRVYKVGE